MRMEDLGPNLYQALPRGELALLPQAFGFPHPPEPAPHSPLAPPWLLPGWLLGAGHQLALLFHPEFGISSFPGRIEASYP